MREVDSHVWMLRESLQEFESKTLIIIIMSNAVDIEFNNTINAAVSVTFDSRKLKQK